VAALSPTPRRSSRQGRTKVEVAEAVRRVEVTEAVRRAAVRVLAANGGLLWATDEEFARLILADLKHHKSL
jgi:hypothetical protein